MAAIPQPRRLTVEEYLELDRNDPDHRYEYHDGDIRMMSGGSLNHSSISFNLALVIGPPLRGKACHPFNSDAKVQVSSSHYVYPDATISCDPQDRGVGDVVQSPRVVFEVLSPGTQAYDLGDKADLYRACPSIEEIVFIHAVRPQIDLFRRAEKFWEFQSYKGGESLTLTSVGIDIVVDDLYIDIEFPNGSDGRKTLP